ncbi:hypothetical protein KIPB_006063, partial [Kipferlia bialata]
IPVTYIGTPVSNGTPASVRARQALATSILGHSHG